ncbi:MAG: hypothetical protein HQL51_01170 [Magnetococcales bacterium]|nr:hypothetical protein [Magnetococcales bacterium]
MIAVQKGGASEEVRQKAKHRLFVEGKGDRALDPQVLGALLPMITIEPLGPCFSIRNVAQALASVHPNDYFLADRDEWDEETVEKSWRNFPDPDQSNLLIWRKRELENYFIDPEYLSKSKFIKGNIGIAGLSQAIEKAAHPRLFLDVANQVVMGLRKRQQWDWVHKFTQPEAFPNAEAALEQLLNAPEWKQRTDEVRESLTPSNLQSLFDQTLAEFSGGVIPLKTGHGAWRDLMGGKEIFHAILQRYFRVVDNQGNVLQGPQQRREVIKDLLARPLAEQPTDFQELHRLIETRIRVG